MSGLYESSTVGAFMYSWGYEDGRNRVGNVPGLLVNAQNPLDGYIGDLFGEVPSEDATKERDGRYFLIEFKKDYQGFSDEVHGSAAKAQRTALYNHLRNDKRSRSFALHGHFAIWWTPEGLQVAGYANAVGPRPGAKPNPPIYDIDNQRPSISFRKFYKGLNHYSRDLYAPLYPHLFQEGIGIPFESMRRYLKSMVENTPPLTKTDEDVSRGTSELIFGCVSKRRKKILAIGTFEGLLSACKKFSETTSTDLGIRSNTSID